MAYFSTTFSLVVKYKPGPYSCLFDAGTLSNLPSGYKTRGFRIRDDAEPLQPGEFRDVDAPNGIIREALMPLPYKGPDQVLMQLLGFCVDAAKQFIKDIVGMMKKEGVKFRFHDLTKK